MEVGRFDPADYLDSEEAIAAYLEDARQDEGGAFSRALDVVARARRRLRRPQPISLDELRTAREHAPHLRVSATVRVAA